MSCSGDQKRTSGSCGNVFWGAVASVSTDSLGKISGQALGIDYVVEGSLYVADTDKLLLQNKYSLSGVLSETGYIPYLYDSFGIDFLHRLSGQYNVFVFIAKHDTAFLFNDRLGVLPLFYYEDGTVFIFASRLEALLKSGLISNPLFDTVSFAEHILFHYIISDHTYIKGISSLSHAALYTLREKETKSVCYWSVSDLLQVPLQHEMSDFDFLQSALQKAVERSVPQGDKPYNFTLTGGWDSRILLAYLLPHSRVRLRAYSFGAENSSDILVPAHIAQKEGFSYTPLVLDKEYLNQDFLTWAKQTIMLSGGSRNYKRTHYLYAASKMSTLSDSTLTGIFGDEVLKVGKPVSGEVLSPVMLDWLASDFDNEVVASALSRQRWLSGLSADTASLTEELLQRLKTLSHEYSGFTSLSEKYFAFRFTLNLRKYFGNEVNSYNDYLRAEMPFLDYNFLRSYAATGYAGFRYPFRKGSLLSKRRTTLLYYRLTAKSYPSLTEYDSSRGFSMHEALTPAGMYRIIKNKLLRQHRERMDGFNTRPTDQMFYDLLSHTKIQNPIITHPLKPETQENVVCNFNSLYYWASEIADQYM